MHGGGARGNRQAAREASSDLEVFEVGLVNIRTHDHGPDWIDRFQGDIDYTLKVMVASIDAYDKRLIAAADLSDVRTIFVMEEMKRTTALPIPVSLILRRRRTGTGAGARAGTRARGRRVSDR